MRKLEFRATRKDTKETFEVLDLDWMHSSVFLAGHMIEVDMDKVIIQQFIGQTDSKGVKIFEGDKISDHVGIGVVVYSKNKSAFKVDYQDGFYKWFLDYNLKGEKKSIEVIGNIHESIAG